jgi:hypothetical protein
MISACPDRSDLLPLRGGHPEHTPVTPNDGLGGS